MNRYGNRWTMAMTRPRLTVKQAKRIKRAVESALAKYPDKKAVQS